MDDVADLGDRSYREGLRDGRVQAGIVAAIVIAVCVVGWIFWRVIHA